MVVACVAGVGAWAGFDQSVGGASIYADELFGMPTELSYPSGRVPMVDLELKDHAQVDGADISISFGSSARVKFDFANGTFTEAILPGDLTCRVLGKDERPASDNPASPTDEPGCVTDSGVTIHEGGAVGDSSVTFEIKIVADATGFSGTAGPGSSATAIVITSPSASPRQSAVSFRLRLKVPTLKASGRVAVSSSIETRQGDIPRMIKRCPTPDMPATKTMNEADPCEAVVRTAKALTANTKASAGAVSIDLNDFKMLNLHKTGAAKGKPTSNTVGSYTFEVTNVSGTNDILGADGQPLEEDAAATLTVLVGGDLNPGDVIDVAGTKLTVGAGGDAVTTNVTLASASQGLGDITPDVVGSGANLYKKAVAVKYTPAGKAELIHGDEIDVTFTPRFARAENKAIKMSMMPAKLMIAGVTSDLKAYAIPASTNGKNDVANVRIRCVDGDRMSETHENMCRTFAQCWDDDGMGGVGEHGDGIAENATIVLNAMDFETASGLAAMGRHSCRILTTGTAAVQVLVRDGTTGTLVNNTFVRD